MYQLEKLEAMTVWIHILHSEIVSDIDRHVELIECFTEIKSKDITLTCFI